MFVNEIEKLSAYIGLDVFAVRRVELGNIAMPLASVRRGILGRFAVLSSEATTNLNQQTRVKTLL